MASILVHTGDESVTLTAQAVRKLLEKGNGDAALLYLALLRHHGEVQPRALAGELRWEKGRIESAEAALRDLGLLAPAAEQILEPADERPTYQREDIIQRMEESAEFRRLTEEVEKKLGKRLTTQDISTLLGLYDYLGLPSDVIYLLVGHCTQRITKRYGDGRRPTMRQIEKEGYFWARQGVDTQKAAVAYLKKYNDRQGVIAAYMNALCLGDRAPVASEEKYLLAWAEMGFEVGAVALAYDKTVLKCHELKWPYCNGILRRWHQENLHTVAQIQANDRPAASTKQSVDKKDKKQDTGWMKQYIQQRD